MLVETSFLPLKFSGNVQALLQAFSIIVVMYWKCVQSYKFDLLIFREIPRVRWHSNVDRIRYISTSLHVNGVWICLVVITFDTNTE